MRRDDSGLVKIAEESKKFVGVERKNKTEEFRQTVLENIFLKELGYWKKIPLAEQGKVEITVGEKLKIKVTMEEVEERKAVDQLFMEQVDGEVRAVPIEWGILISPKGLWLFNSQVCNRKKGLFQSETTVLEIIHGKNTDQKYFQFFSYDNILGNRPNANYFRDIIIYKNFFYKGNETSWRAYHSALKRFFKYYAERVGYFKNENQVVYDAIQGSDFQKYAKSEMKIEKENTLKNAFYYIKDFMNCMSNSDAFHISAKDMIDSFSWNFEEEDKQSIMDPIKLRNVIQYLEKGKNKERDVALFLMLLAFGTERRKICLLKWKDVHIEKGQRTLDQGSGEVLMPQKLAEALRRLKDLDISSKYVFYRTKEKKDEPMREAAVNEVFSKLVNIEHKDPFYKVITPANIRSSLIQYLLRHGYRLEEIIYLVNIEMWNLGNYISREDISDIMKKRREGMGSEVTKSTCVMIHPMDDFFQLLLT